MVSTEILLRAYLDFGIAAMGVVLRGLLCTPKAVFKNTFLLQIFAQHRGKSSRSSVNVLLIG